jgi:hypothetical protein
MTGPINRLQNLLSIVLMVVSLNIGAQIDNSRLDQFYRSDHMPNELNRDNYERLKDTYREYIKVNGNRRGFDEEKFVYEYNYFLDRINRSGNVFYGDEISSYVNEIKDQILKINNINLVVTVYVTDYVDLNAFTNDFGNIYVNIATIAKLNSEQELMVVIAHEIGHVILKHSRKSEFYSNEIDENVSINKEEGVFKIHAFSRENEIEADSIAHQLLKNYVSKESFYAVLSRLEYAENPTYDGEVDLSLLAPNNSVMLKFILEKYASLTNLPKPYQIDTDSLSTHPSIEERILFSNAFFEHNSISISYYEPLRNYSEIKFLASNVLLNSYIENEKFVEALDLVLKLRSKEDSNWLIYQQSKLLTLIVQEKYNQSLYDLLDINIACNDDHFIRFKQFVKVLSKIDFNILAYDYHKKATNLNSEIQKEWIFQYLYGKNEKLFIIDTISNVVRYNEWTEDLSQMDSLINDSIEINLNEVLDSLNILSSCYTPPSKTSHLLEKFLKENTISKQEEEFISKYHEKKKLLEKNISSQGDIFLHPAYAAELYHHGIFQKSKNFDHTKKAVLIQSDNLYFLSKDKNQFSLHYKKSLKLNARLKDLSQRYNSFSEDYSLSSSSNTTVKDNYIHKVLMLWIFQNTEENKLNYSTVEDEIQRYLISQNVEYIVYRLSILNRNKGKGRKFNINYYEIYFDVNSKGIVYIAKIGSKQFPDRFQIEQMVYLSELNKKL